MNVGLAGARGDTYDAIKGCLDEQLKDMSIVAVMGRRRAELEVMRHLIKDKWQLGLLAPPILDGVYRWQSSESR